MSVFIYLFITFLVIYTTGSSFVDGGRLIAWTRMMIVFFYNELKVNLVLFFTVTKMNFQER